ncbi:MAG: hypothetical protein AAF604_16280 [Acidobacteriota bacterium]
MKFLTALRHGLRRTHQHLGLVLIAWLASLLPTVLITSIFLPNLAENLDHSLFAQSQIAGNGFGVWTDLAASRTNDLAPLQDSAPLRAVIVLLIQILVSAGIVQTLLGTSRRDQHPFLQGIGRNGWRFLRSALWFLLAVAVLAALLAGAMGWVTDLGAEQRNGGLQLNGWLIVALLGFLAFAPLDLAYDLSRVSAAAHGDGRTFVGFFRALGHVLKRPLILLPLYFLFMLLGAAFAIGAFALRAGWVASSVGAVFGLLALQQGFMLLRSYLRVGLWGSEIAYYQAIGEPRWCGRKETRKAPAPTAATKAAATHPEARRAPAKAAQPATVPIVPTAAAATAGASAAPAPETGRTAEDASRATPDSEPAPLTVGDPPDDEAAYQETTMRLLPVDITKIQEPEAPGETLLQTESPTLALDAREIAAHLEEEE